MKDRKKERSELLRDAQYWSLRKIGFYSAAKSINEKIEFNNINLPRFLKNEKFVFVIKLQSNMLLFMTNS